LLAAGKHSAPIPRDSGDHAITGAPDEPVFWLVGVGCRRLCALSALPYPLPTHPTAPQVIPNWRGFAVFVRSGDDARCGAPTSLLLARRDGMSAIPAMAPLPYASQGIPDWRRFVPSKGPDLRPYSCGTASPGGEGFWVCLFWLNANC